MRKWMVLLLLISTSAALSIGIYYLRNQTDDEIGESVELPEPREYVVVFYGKEGDFEFLLRPYYGDGGEDVFHADQLNRLLGGQADFAFGRLWIVNHSDAAMDLDVTAESILDLVWGEGKRGKTQSLKSLAEGNKNLSRAAQMVFTTLGQINKTKMAGRELVDLALVLPGQIDLEQIESVRQGKRGVVFRQASARRVDLLQYISQPRGYIEKLLITRDDQKEDQEQASRK